jgi:serine/threonine protein phosphatase PrpC
MLTMLMISNYFFLLFSNNNYYFIYNYKIHRVLAVADGVGGWASHG